MVNVVLDSERDKARLGDFGWVRPEAALSCYRGVWDEGANFDRSQRQKVIVDTKRGKNCFFWRHEPGMMLPTARELQAREAQLREANKSRRISWVAVAISLTSSAVAYLALAGDRHWWPF